MRDMDQFEEEIVQIIRKARPGFFQQITTSLVVCLSVVAVIAFWELVRCKVTTSLTTPVESSRGYFEDRR